MRSGTNSLLTMLFTAVPLLAVPALAIFGIPQFSPMSASPPSEHEERLLLEEDPQETDELLRNIDPWADTSADQQSSSRQRRIRENDLQIESGGRSRREAVSPDENVPVAVLGIAADTDSHPLPADHRVDAERNSDSAEVDEFISEATNNMSADSQSAPSENHVPRERSWRNAVHELNRLGIQNYRLEPGSGKETFLFRCVLTSPGTPQVVRQFEAEAGEPLDAVADVIRQARDHVRAPLGN